MLAAVADPSPSEGDELAVAAVVVAVLASLMVSYTRARAEALGRGVQGRHRGPHRAGRHPLRRPRLREASMLDVLAPAVYVLAALSTITVFQRIWHVRRELTRARDGLVTPSPLAGFVVRRTHSGGITLSQNTSEPSTNGGSRYQNEKVRVAIIGVGNCASAFVQGVQYYKDADPTERVPGPHARRPRRLPRPRHRVLGGLRHRRREGRQGPLRGDLVRPEQHDQVRQGGRAEPRRPRQRGMTHDGLGKYLKQKITKAEGSTVDIAQVLKDTQDRRRRLLPAGRLRAGDQVVRRADPRGRLRRS